MKRSLVLFVFTFAFSFILNSSDPIKILKQSSNSRVLSKNEVRVHKLINSDNLTPPLLKPVHICCDDSGSFYISSGYNEKIHKFTPNEDFSSFAHKEIGKGKGQGPGEVTRVTHVAAKGDKIFLVNNGGASIIVYSNISGNYLKSLNLSNIISPFRIILSGENYILQQVSNIRPEMFSCFNSDWKWQKNFGGPQTSDATDILKYSNVLSPSFSVNKFYCAYRYLGYVELYQGEQLMFRKETIDGLKPPPSVLTRKVDSNKTETKLGLGNYYTAYSSALHHNFILIKAYDRYKKMVYWDLYDLSSFRYLMSVKNPPPSSSMAFVKNFLVTFDDEDNIVLFDFSSIIQELKLK